MLKATKDDLKIDEQQNPASQELSTEFDYPADNNCPALNSNDDIQYKSNCHS